MDANKRLKLLEIGYKMNGACGNCKHGVFNERLEFGTCSLHTYVHEKHTVPARNLSVHKAGYCDNHMWSEQELEFIHGFKEFL